MGSGESKFCSSCEKKIKVTQFMPKCCYCHKTVCTDCSNRQTISSPSKLKVRVCHVCFISKKNAQGSFADDIIVNKPKAF